MDCARGNRKEERKLYSPWSSAHIARFWSFRIKGRWTLGPLMMAQNDGYRHVNPFGAEVVQRAQAQKGYVDVPANETTGSSLCGLMAGA